jgi:hypothetical protein
MIKMPVFSVIESPILWYRNKSDELKSAHLDA